MELAVHLGYWGGGVDAREQLELARAAESCGYHSAWVAEAYGSDAATVLAWLAAGTSAIRLGSAVLQIPARSAAMTAMTAATIDRLSGGRMLLGLGASGPQVAEGWHGQRFDRQLQRTRDYVAVVRMALARERVAFAGETLTMPLPDGPGRALKLTIAPVQERIPILLAAIGPRNVALAGEVADGWLPMLHSPAQLRERRALLDQGAARAGRSLEGFVVAPNVYLAIDDDEGAARDAARPLIALYVGGMGSRERNFYNRAVAELGFEAAAREIQDLFLDGRQREAAAAVPDGLIDTICLCGSRARVAARLDDYRAAGVDILGVTPLGRDRAGRLATLAALAELNAAAPA